MLLSALFLRPARAKPVRLLATVLGVAAGVAALVSTRVSSRAAVGTLTEDIAALAGPARLEIVQDGGVDVALLAALAPIASEAAASPVVDAIVVAPALGDTLRLLGVDAIGDRLDARIGLATTESGAAGLLALARGLDCQGVWISAALAADLGLEPGGALELVVRARAVRLEILGLFAPKSATRAFDRVVLLDVACAQELLGTPRTVDRIELVPRGKVDLERLAGRVRTLLPPGARVQEPGARADEARALARTLAFHLDVMALISLVVGGVLVAISLATAVVQRREVLAVLVSLGASRGQLGRALALEALGIGLLGGFAGTLLGWAAAAVSAAGVRATLAVAIGQAPRGATEPEAGDLLIGLGLGGATALAAALLPIVEARRTPPIQGLRRERPEALGGRGRARSLAGAAACIALAPVLASMDPWRDLPIPALAGAFALQAALFLVLGPVIELTGHAGARSPLPRKVHTLLRLALSALAAGRRRAVWAAGAVGAAVGLSVAIATVVGSFRATIVDWSAHAFTADFWIRPRPTDIGGILGELDPTIVELAREQFGTEALDPFYFGTAHYSGETVGLAGAEFAVVRHRGIMSFVDGRPPRAVFEAAWERGEVVVNQAFGLRFDVHAGDLVRFEAGGKTLEKRVAGVFVDYGESRGQIIVDGPQYRALFPGALPAQIALFLPPEVDRARARREFVAALPPDARVEMISVAELREQILAIFEQTFAVTRGMEAVAAAVAVIAVLTVLFALLSERKSEIGILRALGASPGQVGATIGLQAGLLGGLGALGGCTTGLGVGWILVEVVQVQSFRWTLDFRVPWLAMGETLTGVTLVCAAAGLWPALVASRWSPRELLREEE